MSSLLSRFPSNSELALQLQENNWGEHIGEPVENAEFLESLADITRKVEEDPDTFFAWPYSEPFEELCLQDHRAAEGCDKSVGTKLAQIAYKQVWSRQPLPELCALVADDVCTILSLLSSTKPLRRFTTERIDSYQNGRIPWGYRGTFPDGCWVVL